MRLDKWLKLSRVIKRRSVANEICDQGRVTINGRPAKASVEVKATDKLVIRFGQRLLELEILAVPAGQVSTKMAKELYQTLGETSLKEVESELNPAGAGDDDDDK
ncbi:MAG: ribosome-associated heat shock protein [Cyanobacteria bacterium RYN_339]|nr:ribosome-associated heat shock protein [Cyanobacteria bacterium RYN_339]